MLHVVPVRSDSCMCMVNTKISKLFSRKFVVYSDHKPLKHLFENNYVRAKVRGWRISVSGFDFEVKYLESTSKVITDPSSRIDTIAEVEDLNTSLLNNAILLAQKIMVNS